MSSTLTCGFFALADFEVFVFMVLFLSVVVCPAWFGWRTPCGVGLSHSPLDMRARESLTGGQRGFSARRAGALRRCRLSDSSSLSGLLPSRKACLWWSFSWFCRWLYWLFRFVLPDWCHGKLVGTLRTMGALQGDISAECAGLMAPRRLVGAVDHCEGPMANAAGRILLWLEIPQRDGGLGLLRLFR